MHRLQDANCHKGDDYRGAAVAHEGQRYSRDGHDPDGHADVDEDLEHQHRGDSAHDQRSVQVLGHYQNPQRPPYEEGVQGKYECATGEPEFLAYHREYEVRVVLGNEVQLRLRGTFLAPACFLAGADPDDRLLELIPLLARVVGRVDERRETIDLVGLEHLDADRGRSYEHDRDGAGGQCAQYDEMRPLRARHEQHSHGDRHVDEARAEVRLDDHQHRGQDGQQEDARSRLDLG